MSWNQSVCFLKNKLAWSGCGLVWQVGCGRICSVWVCIVLVGLVWVWQVGCVCVRCVLLRLVPFRCGRCGAVRQVTQCSDGFGRGTLGFGRCGVSC